jgi:hypothetical protein
MHPHSLPPKHVVPRGRISRSDSGGKHQGTKHLRMPGQSSTDHASHTPSMFTPDTQENSVRFSLPEVTPLYSLSGPWGGGGDGDPKSPPSVPPFHIVRRLLTAGPEGYRCPDPPPTRFNAVRQHIHDPVRGTDYARSHMRTPRPPQSNSRNLFVFGWYMPKAS